MFAGVRIEPSSLVTRASFLRVDGLPVNPDWVVRMRALDASLPDRLWAAYMTCVRSNPVRVFSLLAAALDPIMVPVVQLWGSRKGLCAGALVTHMIGLESVTLLFRAVVVARLSMVLSRMHHEEPFYIDSTSYRVGVGAFMIHFNVLQELERVIAAWGVPDEGDGKRHMTEEEKKLMLDDFHAILRGVLLPGEYEMVVGAAVPLQISS